ncbi:MAG: McrC family protein, partial [Sandaracinaceae bacterium]|nr:McrC family protein [Sandaracinaceae bacterium]
MSRTTIRVFEHERLTIGQELRSTDGRFLRFEEPCFDAIVRFNDQHGGRYFGVGHRSVKLQHYVGYLQVGSLGIEVLPKVDRAGESEKARWHDALLHMLAATRRLHAHLRTRASVALRSANLLDVFIAEFLGEVRRLLHEGLIKSYRAIDENCTSFKGRLLVRDNVRENLVHAERFYVSHTAYDANALPNHILKAALDALSHVSLPGALHNERIALVAAFPDVDRRALDAREFEGLRFDRRTERYRRAIELAKLIILHHSPRLRAGDADLLALLFDMNALWEAYVAVILRRAAPDGMTVSSQSARLFWTAPGQSRTLRPDILVHRRRDRINDRIGRLRHHEKGHDDQGLGETEACARRHRGASFRIGG